VWVFDRRRGSYVTGSGARMTDTTKGKLSDATIIAIVDAIEKDGVLTYEKAVQE
jgi:hypothetical protein